MAFVKSTSTTTAEAITVSGLSGGTNGRCVRITTNNTVVDATYNDTVAQLQTILLKQNDTYYASGAVGGFTGLTSGASYFLGSNGAPTASVPTPSSTVRALYIGFAINSTTLIFKPSIVITGT